MPSRKDLRGIGEKLGAWWSSGKLNFGSLQAFLEGYVAHRSFHGYVSGDFYAIKSAGDSMGLLLGDGMGEAVPGLLNALPLMTSFELFGSDTGSTRYVMEKLMTVANKIGIMGTGLYCTFTQIEKDIFLSVTSAAHPFLILIRADGVENRIPWNGGPGDGPSFGHNLKVPLSEEHKTLKPGDTLIAYTDGVGEALCHRSELPEVYAQRIVTCAMNSAFESCEDIAEGIMSAAEAAGPIHDDMTVCVVRVKQSA
jgi:serine phosphatase RsbU (regulator of sigma subunit)